MAERTPDRLVRLLGLVAYLDRHPGAVVEDVATHFGVSRDQVLRDVDTLWVSGTPGYWPDDLIDFDADSHDFGVLRLTQSRGMTRALRLGTREAVALVAALRALCESVGEALDPDEREVLTSTLAALTAATGEAAASIDVQLTIEALPEVVGSARTAVRERRRLRIRYVDASDAVSERDVDPWQVLTGDEHSYLQAWCHNVEGERLFRLDRILAATVLDSPVATRPGPVRETTFTPSDEHDRVALVLDGSARWVVEQFPVEQVTDLPDGRFRVVLQVASPAWLQHLLLRLGSQVRGAEPLDVAGDAASAARRALALYGIGGG